MYKKFLLIALAISAVLLKSTVAYAMEVDETTDEIEIEEDYQSEDVDENEDIELQAADGYSMILDEVKGANIETFCIERPDPGALKNRIINASTFGLSVDNEDNYKAFEDALKYCKDNPDTYLVIDKGVYYFKTNESLHFTGLKNVLIEGNGAEFIFETQKQFSLSECDGVELRNLIVDWNWAKDRVASLVKVQNSADDSFEIKFLELDDVDVDIPLVSFQQYDSNEHVPGSYGGYKSFAPAEVPGSVLSVEKIESNVLKIYKSSKFTTSFHNEEVYSLRHYTYGGAVFTVTGNSSNITFDNVRIYGSAGMGFVFGDKSNHFQIINSYIGLRPGNENNQRLATSADGIHILNTDGYFRIDNCDLSYTGDDIINIHDDLLMITEIPSKNQVNGIVTGGFVKKGDKIRIYDRNVSDIGFETEVVSFSRSTDPATLILKDELPDNVSEGFFVYRSSSRTHNYVISNNYIHETKGRAALLNAPDALFVNNKLYRTVSECVQVRMDLADRTEKIWFEGSGSKNVVIKDNTFEECAFGGKDSIITIDCSIGTKSDALSDVHITGNKFYYCYGELINADNITDLYIENNYIADCGEIVISNNCGTVYNNDNTIVYPSKECDHADTKQVLAREPGCFEYGSTGKTYCNKCHTIIDHNYIGLTPLKHKNLLVKRIDVAPTCTESGLSSQVCSLCRTVMETDNVEPATGHNYVAESGSGYHTCTNCGKREAHNGIGTCSICGDGKSVWVKQMSLELDTANVNYIGVNLYIDAPTGTVFYVDGDIAEAENSSDGLYKIQYRCAPKELADKHILKAKDPGKNQVNINDSAEYTFSGDMYCKKVLAEESGYSDKLKNVAKGLVGYSEQARSYFGYNDEGLEPGDVTAKISSSSYVMKTTGGLPQSCEYMGSSLIMGDELILRHYFKGNGSRLRVSCTNRTKAVNISVTRGSLDSSSVNYVDIKVPYSGIGDMYELKVTAYGYSESYTMRYGILTYCNKAREKNMNSRLVNLCNSLYNYYVAISAYGKAS